MLTNSLKIAYRNILRQKAYSFITVFGLALGLTACILVGLYIWQEFHYDDYHKHADQIYRVSLQAITPNGTFHSAETSALIAPSLEANFPEIERITRIYFSSENLIAYGEKRFYEDNVIFADPDFFEMFSYRVLQGDESQFLKKNNTIVISQKVAQKFFGHDSPIGKVIHFNNRIDLEIVGVIKEVPVNSHFHFDMVTTYETLRDLPVGNYLDQWGATFGSYTYLLLNPVTDMQSFERQVDQFLNKNIPLIPGIEIESVLQPVRSIHLYSHTEDEIQPNGSIRYILIIGSISFCILILACINFINLTTARSVKRAREIGVRKVFGAFRYQLIRQFLCESIVTTFIALLCALGMVELFKPFFSQLIGTELLYNSFDNLAIVLTILGATFCLGILAGLYPAFVLTHYKPAQVIRGSNAILQGKKGSALLRKGLVIGQFSVSIILIIFTIVVNQQIRFMRNFDMGFQKEHTLILNTPERLSSQKEAIQNELQALPGVRDVAASLGAPVFHRGFATNLIPDIRQKGSSFLVAVKAIDYNFLDLYGIELLAGKRLSDLEGVDFRSVAMVNESTVKKLGFANPADAVGHAYTLGLSHKGKAFEPEIIGVVKDFHFSSLHEEIQPLLFMYWPALFQEFSIQLAPSSFHQTIRDIQNIWKEFYPEHPFTYSFLDDRIAKLYKAEERSFRVISTFSILAIFIACLGFLGLAFFSTEQRRKEIGIRKVLGASVGNIINRILLEFLTLVVIGNLVAWPVSYFAIRKWLARFPYTIGIHLSYFIVAGLIAVLISATTILYIVLKSAASDPVESLRYE